MSIARDHHYVPQFYLRNFAVDAEKKKVTIVAKHGPIVVWSKRSIESLGFERDLYVSLSEGVPTRAHAMSVSYCVRPQVNRCVVINVGRFG